MTRAARRLAVCKSEFGNKTSTTSPRLAFIVDGGFGTFPIFSESFQARAQISGLDSINAAIMQGNGGIFRGDFSQFFLHSQSLDGTQLRQFRNDFSCAHVLNLTSDGRFAKSNSCL